MIAYSPPAVRPLRLGQAARFSLAQPRAVKVTVHDVNGRPVAGAEVEALADGRAVASGVADSAGDVTFEIPADRALSFRTRSGDRSVWTEASTQEIARGDTIFVRLPVCLAQPFLTVAEIAALVAAVALTGGGFLWKVEALKITGEVLFGAAAFTAIYRHSCL